MWEDFYIFMVNRSFFDLAFMWPIICRDDENLALNLLPKGEINSKLAAGDLVPTLCLIFSCGLFSWMRKSLLIGCFLAACRYSKNSMIPSISMKAITVVVMFDSSTWNLMNENKRDKGLNDRWSITPKVFFSNINHVETSISASKILI